MTTPAATALRLLRDSRDAEHDAPVWADNGRTVRRLARAAGVAVVYLHVELGVTWKTELRTVDISKDKEGGE